MTSLSSALFFAYAAERAALSAHLTPPRAPSATADARALHLRTRWDDIQLELSTLALDTPERAAALGRRKAVNEALRELGLDLG